MIICPLYYIFRKYNLYLDDLEEKEYQRQYEEEQKNQKESGEKTDGESDQDDQSDHDQTNVNNKDGDAQNLDNDINFENID